MYANMVIVRLEAFFSFFSITSLVCLIVFLIKERDIYYILYIIYYIHPELRTRNYLTVSVRAKGAGPLLRDGVSRRELERVGTEGAL